MKPNIHRSGRIARAISGTLCAACGLGFLVFQWPSTPWVRWVYSLALIGAGAFQWYEARKSWCVMRACGFKTPM